MKDKNVLILTPSLDNSGGVANYYSIMQHRLAFTHEFFIVGNRESEDIRTGILSFVTRLIVDYSRFIRTLWHGSYDLILINPSLNKKGITRDYIFYLIAKLFHNKTIIFFRGWDNACAESVFHGRLKIIFNLLLNSDGFIVLASSFKKFITPKRDSTPVFVETTVFDESILPDDFDALNTYKCLSGNPIRLLFFSRIEKDKGIYQCIEMFNELRQRSVDVDLTIAGNGSEAENVSIMIEQLDNKAIRYVGRVGGNAKKELLLSSDILLFPSAHAEGMPNTVLEAIACGQAIISTRMGGLDDFFDGELMGAEINGSDIMQMVESVESLCNDKDRLKSIARYNFEYARSHFYSKKVAQRLDDIVDSVLDNSHIEAKWVNK